jgi:hypothetical protein
MQHYIQSVHIKLSYFTIKLQSSKRSETNLGGALVGQLIKMGYLLKTTTELIGNNRGLVDRIGKEGSYLYSFRKSADFISEEKSA